MRLQRWPAGMANRDDQLEYSAPCRSIHHADAPGAELLLHILCFAVQIVCSARLCSSLQTVPGVHAVDFDSSIDA